MGDCMSNVNDIAVVAVQAMDSAFHGVTHQNRVGPDTEIMYSDGFFKPLDLITNALDNVDTHM